MEHTRVKLKDHIRETQLFGNRIVAAGVVVVLMLMMLVARMVYLQIASHEHYTTLSLNNRVNIVPVAPTRGLIFDRNGEVLAENIPTFTLELVPEKIDNLEDTIERLKKIVTLSDNDIEHFYKMKKRTSAFKAIPLRFQLDEDEVARFSVRQHLFPGVELNARLTRYYPYGETAVHALGYVGRINEQELKILDETNYKATTHVGKLGVEKQYEDYLHGTVGYRKVETNAKGRILRVLEEQLPEPGKNIYLTLDVNVQKVAEEKLKGRRGAVVAISPKTGDVIALVSMPGYDPNLFVNGIDEKNYRALASSKDRPLFNRAIKGRYPPGSTLKPFMGLAGLEYDVVHQGTTINCRGWYQLKNDEHKYRDWKRIGHGPMTLHTAIRESCDVYFYDMALHLGIDNIHEFNNYFGFGQATGIDIPGETKGLLPSREWKRRVKKEAWYPGETLITGIGQGFNVASPIQIATATATLANYGLHIRPHLGMAISEEKDGELTYFEPEVVGTVPIKNKSNWDYMFKSMESVVHSRRGTARRISKGAQFKIAGKTGTAQVFGIAQGEKYDKENTAERLRDHALFIAFAPVDDPEIAVAAIVENGESGGGVAAPIVRAVLDAYLLGKKDHSG
ncbi:MAG: penicillin-binding protein 2 [Gammaproteobacteria bacterium]|nr:penicillin-binding protein 2 [Gammaproteobacteria bacterium]